MTLIRLTAAALAWVWLPALAAEAAKPALVVKPTDCNRHCLLEMLTVYTEALSDNQPARLPVASDVRATANGEVRRPGTGEVWGQVKRIPYRQAFVDPSTGTAIFLGTLTNTPTRDAARWWFYALRLQVGARHITQIEEISYDGMLGGTPASSLHLPNSIYDEVLPPAEQSSIKDMMGIADHYFDAVSGTVNYHEVPWHPECQRIELGTFTVNSELNAGSCGGEFQNPAMRWLVKDRRFYIADAERGIVVAIANFTTPPAYPNNNGSVVFEAFKIQDGLIRHIEAFFRGNGQLHSGWDEGPGP